MSGGIDSAACAHLLKTQGLAVRGLFIDFGQPAAEPEADAAESLATIMDMPLERYVLSGGSTIPIGELVGRNAFLVFGALFLTRGSPGLIALGIHAGTPYYDCSGPFLDSMKRLVDAHTDGSVSLIAPFLHWSKADIVSYFNSARLPMHVTYSCEAGSRPPCGRCISCRDRNALSC